MLFLFDIDGTLLWHMPPAHRQAICDGLRAVYGVRLRADALGQTAGMTDTAIARRELRTAGLTPQAIADGLYAFFAAAADAYARLVPADLRPYIIPHARETLEWLRARTALLGLVTGNIERIAWRKLAAAGLATDFACGAFGDEAEAREALPPLAVARAARLRGGVFPPDAVWVVGDTPADIACGAASGYHTIGVATGPVHALEHLRDCTPDHVFPDLSGVRTLAFFARSSE